MEREFPLLSISVAALACEEPPQMAAEELIRQLAPVKARAKAQTGNSLEVETCMGCGSGECKPKLPVIEPQDVPPDSLAASAG